MMMDGGVLLMNDVLESAGRSDQLSRRWREVQNSVGSRLVTPAKLVPVKTGSGSPVPVFTGTSMVNGGCWPVDSRPVLRYGVGIQVPLEADIAICAPPDSDVRGDGRRAVPHPAEIVGGCPFTA